MKPALKTDQQPAPLLRRTFFGRCGGMIAAFVAGVPLIHRVIGRNAGVPPSSPANDGARIGVRIHPLAVPRTSTRSLPNV
jgi:hypothetical protein